MHMSICVIAAMVLTQLKQALAIVQPKSHGFILNRWTTTTTTTIRNNLRVFGRRGGGRMPKDPGGQEGAQI